MPGFLYFLPISKRAAEPADFRAAGCDYALPDPRAAGIQSLRVEDGPGTVPGLVCTIDGDGVHPAHKPPTQEWRKGQSGRFWVGRDVSAPAPGPADLARPKIYPGTAVQLLDGNDWVIPNCTDVLDAHPSSLPRVIDLDPDGLAITTPHPRYKALSERAHGWWLEWAGVAPAAGRLGPEQRLQLAVDALAVNYRIGRLEAIALGKLFDTDALSMVLRAMIDADELEAFFKAEAAKKNISPPPGSDTSSGATASDPATP